MSTPSALPPHNVWQPLDMQLLAFPEQADVHLASDWWQQLTGSNDFESLRKRLTRVDAGVFEGHTLRLDMEPVRFTWTALPHVDASGEPLSTLMETIPTLGDFHAASGWFSEHMRHWLAEFAPPLKRLAFATKLYQHAPDRAAAYRLLQHYLPRVQVDPSATEFQYRINRKRASGSGIPGLEINRLATWSAVQYQIFARAQMEGAPAFQEAVSAPHLYGALAHLDINSAAEFRAVLPRDHIVDLFDELVRLASEIADAGDVA